MRFSSKRKLDSKLFQSGYIYNSAKLQINSELFYCEKRQTRKCKGAILRNANGTIEVLRQHNHEPNPVKGKADILKVGFVFYVLKKVF